jgi:tetratricopeptide (TPR) repeat protein
MSVIAPRLTPEKRMMMVDQRRDHGSDPPDSPDPPADDDVDANRRGQNRRRVGPWRRIWAPSLAGLVTAAGVLAGIASSMSAPNAGQVFLAALGSVLPGVFAAWQTREQLIEKELNRSGPGSDPPALPELPPDVADFTGRDELTARLTDILTPPARGSRRAVPVVAISGKGGVGKTALAVHVAHRVARHFPDGQLYVDLRGVEDQVLDPADVLAGFLRELGVEGGDVPESLDDRTRMYRTRVGTRRLLVFLDNALDENQVRHLIPGASSCAVLITSRSRLSGLPGSHAESLDVMEPRQALELLAKVIGADRLAEDEEAANRIVRLCGFLPLALRVAAARLASRPAWRLDWFAARLGDERNRLNMLKVGDLEVRASLALSYNSRSDREKQAFRMLGLIKAATFPAWNLAVLTETDLLDAEETAERLVDAELLEVSGIDSVGLVRYRFHDLLRDYARERLAAEESNDAQRTALRRMVNAYVAMAREASAVLQPGALQTSVTDGDPIMGEIVRGNPRSWFASERAALVLLVSQAAESQLWNETWQLAEPLTAMFNWRADWRDWEETHLVALEAANHVGSTLGQAVVRNNLGLLYRELGRFDEAIELLTAAVTAFHELGDEHREALARRNLADAYRYKGRLDEAISSFGSSLEVFERYSDRRSVASALCGMADALRGLSRWEDSESRFARSLALYRQLGDREEEARAKVMLAMVHRDRWRNAAAEALLREGLAAFAELGHKRWEAQSMRLLGTVLRNDGNVAEGIEYFNRCLPIFEDLLDRRFIAITLRNRGDGYRILGDYDRAAADLHRALPLFRELGDGRWAARTQVSLADMHRKLRQWDAAEENARNALQHYREISDRPAEARALRELGMLFRDREEWDVAREFFAQSRDLFADLNDDLWVARTLAGLARLQEMRGQDSRELREQITRICRQCEVPSDRQAVCLAEW